MVKDNYTVGPWARDKLDRLGKYLHAYTTIMRKQKWCDGFTYIDAFAGPGEHQIRKKETKALSFAELLQTDLGEAVAEQEEFIAGSPRVALDIEHPFTHYVFVEKSPERIAQLTQLREEYGSSRSITVRRGDCNKYLMDRVVKNPKINWNTHRAVVFLDPFGMQVNWDTIEALAATKAIEIFLNFPVGMAIQRLLLRRPDEFTQTNHKRLDAYFGSSEWFDILYPKRRDLFGEEHHMKVEKSGEALLKWYRKRLTEAFAHVSKAALIRNTKGGHLYYLLIATHNETGRKIANDILKAGEWV